MGANLSPRIDPNFQKRKQTKTTRDVHKQSHGHVVITISRLPCFSLLSECVSGHYLIPMTYQNIKKGIPEAVEDNVKR